MQPGGGENFYQGYYIQLISGLGNREFVEATENVEDAQSSDPWIDWVRLQDFNGDGHRDIVVDDAAVGVIWLNEVPGVSSVSRPQSQQSGSAIESLHRGNAAPRPIASSAGPITWSSQSGAR